MNSTLFHPLPTPKKGTRLRQFGYNPIQDLEDNLNTLGKDFRFYILSFNPEAFEEGTKLNPIPIDDDDPVPTDPEYPIYELSSRRDYDDGDFDVLVTWMPSHLDASGQPMFEQTWEPASEIMHDAPAAMYQFISHGYWINLISESH